ncbi:hypothetical protein TNCV_3258481 [Trichonephila clavipes]|nr:hypothetical protein TNCV_3258481 [Trichonephila clavipes]
MRRNIFPGLRFLYVLRMIITDDHYRSIFLDPIHPVLQTLFPGERLEIQDDDVYVHKSGCVPTWLHNHDDEEEHLT